MFVYLVSRYTTPAPQPEPGGISYFLQLPKPSTTITNWRDTRARSQYRIQQPSADMVEAKITGAVMISPNEQV